MPGVEVFKFVCEQQMSHGTAATPRIARLANQLSDHIHARALQPGDRFLTTAEASKLLGVGSATANRALQLLERRRLIVRQQRTGAVIAARPMTVEAPMLDRVHFLVHQKYLRAEGVGQDDLLLGIERELPGVNVQISFLPQGSEAGFVRDLVDESLNANRADGFVLVRASYETQRLLSELKIPTVVYGTLYPSIDRLASLTEDMHAVGRELANYLLSRGHQRIAHFGRQIAYRGDHWTMEGIAEALQAAGRGFDSLSLQMLPEADEVYLAEADRALDTNVTGFICRTVRMADAVQSAVEARRLAVGREVDITVCNLYRKAGSRPRFVYAKSVINSEEQGRHLARLLIGQIKGDESARVEIMPIEIEFPVGTDS
jgi:GntR family transcriptional regulator, arabinose operon transcriptional repressor